MLKSIPVNVMGCVKNSYCGFCDKEKSWRIVVFVVKKSYNALLFFLLQYVVVFVMNGYGSNVIPERTTERTTCTIFWVCNLDSPIDISESLPMMCDSSCSMPWNVTCILVVS